jgi:hypothetical protein
MDDQRTNRESGRVIAFSIKRLLLATMLCASGFAMLVNQHLGLPGELYVLISAAMLIGMGILLPFRRPVVGAVIGGLVACAWIAWCLMHFHT